LLEIPEVREDELFPDAAASHGQLLKRAANLIRDDFDAKSWTCFERVVINGESAANVAADLAMTVGAVRQAKYRVLKHLRTFCSDLL
jgi:DNA-directed RNA polymerase specialized sigma24 family protein